MIRASRTGLIRRPVCGLVEIDQGTVSAIEADQGPGPSEIRLGVLGVVVEREGPIVDGGFVPTEGRQGQGPWNSDRHRGAAKDGTVEVDECTRRVTRLGLEDSPEFEQAGIARHERECRARHPPARLADHPIFGELGRGPDRRRANQERA